MMDRQAVLDLMDRSDAVYLATVDGAVPRIRAMVNLRRQDLYPGAAEFCRAAGFTAYFCTSAASGKVRELRANPAASVYYADPLQFHGVELSGRAEVLDDAKLKQTLWDDSWRIYWPAGAADPDCVIVRVVPSEASGWWGSQPFRLDLGS